MKKVEVLAYRASDLPQSALASAYQEWIATDPADYVREEGIEAITKFLGYFGISVIGFDDGRVSTNYHQVIYDGYNAAQAIADYSKWGTGLWLSEYILDKFTTFVMDYPEKPLDIAIYYTYTNASTALEEELIANEEEAAFIEQSNDNNWVYLCDGTRLDQYVTHLKLQQRAQENLEFKNAAKQKLGN